MAASACGLAFVDPQGAPAIVEISDHPVHYFTGPQAHGQSEQGTKSEGAVLLLEVPEGGLGEHIKLGPQKQMQTARLMLCALRSLQAPRRTLSGSHSAITSASLLPESGCCVPIALCRTMPPRVPLARALPHPVSTVDAVSFSLFAPALARAERLAFDVGGRP
ncbi:hypothetical protein [Haliangium sp. UPWRP_2]|uniref:hypothetical protein n=1 Tax=Haliangium sp. UPWRP_2 TaxID=1931276 RepID=UPI000B53F6EE|nr:hypothetical protein [Haliangium sp. UPWRP_2]PSM31263.1 hypothetical protein BVG81_006290 [Haliangium sp. UPWRP_2]